MNAAEYALAANTRLMDMARRLPPGRPPELPAETDPGFWERVVRLEMVHRRVISLKIEQWIASGAAPASMTPLEGLFFRHRFEWASQLCGEVCDGGTTPPVPLTEFLRWATIQTWESDGCIALWRYGIEGGGQPPPESPGSL